MSCHEIVPFQNAFCTALISSLLFVPAAVQLEHPVLPPTIGNVSTDVRSRSIAFPNANDSVSSDIVFFDVNHQECLNRIEVMKNKSDPGKTMKIEIRPFAEPEEVGSGYIVPMHELKCSITVLKDQCLSYNFKWNFDCYDDAFQLVFRTKEHEDVLHLVRKNCDEKYSVCEIEEVRDFLFQGEFIGCNMMVTCCGCVYPASASSNDMIETSGHAAFGGKCVKLGCKSQFINRPIGTMTMKLKHVPFYWVVYLLVAGICITLLALAIISLMSMRICSRHEEHRQGDDVEEEEFDGDDEEDRATSFNSALVSFPESSPVLSKAEADSISSNSTARSD